MLTFPTLSTGAVAQYPLPLSVSSPAQTIRFIDGADQRFRTRAGGLRTWRITLEFLNEDEIYQLEAFFESVQGQYSSFLFPDPYTGQLVPNCRMGEWSLTTDYLAVDLGAASLWVIESHG